MRETAGKLLAERDNTATEFLIFTGDVMGDDLSLYPRFKRNFLTDHSSHLWRADLPRTQTPGAHTLTVSTTDRYGRTYRDLISFEVVATLPNPGWQKQG